ncbi:unnamed protein product [Brassica napus]|uniref:(rape) hypothetical protein n=1 Tax=Brassica napus TaxID=3708 RepID=A0A816LG86_BRANA|nr:unnamed protein product [Brassica napus]
MEAVINSSKLLVVCNHPVIADRNGFKYQFIESTRKAT